MMIRIIQLLTCFLLPVMVMAQVEVHDTTPLGTKFRIIPAALPEPGSYVYFHASLRTQGDSLIFSTRDNGEPAVVNIAGPEATSESLGPVEDVLRFMRTGDQAVVVVDITDFPMKTPGRENDTLVYYDVEVVEVISQAEFIRREAEKEAAAEKLKAQVRSRSEEVVSFHQGIRKKYREGALENIITTESGLKYVVHVMGNGLKPEKGEEVAVHYIGSLVTEGEPFDESFERGEPIKFNVGYGRTIDGWEEGLQLLPRGTKATLFIPAELGYSEGISAVGIPPNSELTFYIELE